MAAVADVQLVNITINDVEVQVPKGELVVESIKRMGIDVPIFCYHPRMKPVGMCRMCLIEIGTKQPDGTVRKMPKPQTACTLPSSEGLVIYTDSELVHNDRRSVLEFLLVNHPLDCPICDRGGECPLQNNTLFYGPSTSRFIEAKRHAKKAFPLSKHVTLDLERCIQCGRCVRFTEEISGDGQLAFRFRGNKMQPSTFQLTEFDSKFSGNTIEICPVGALTNRDYRFRARPWDLQTRPGICTVCSNGCNVHVDYRVGNIVRINGRTNEAVNEEWTCDRGKFGHYEFNSEKRIGTPLVRSEDKLRTGSWQDGFAASIEALASGSVAVLTGGSLSNEDFFVLNRFVRDQVKSADIDFRWTSTLPEPDVSAKSSIESFEDRSAILLFGTSLADDEPILFLRVRKAWFKNRAKIVVASDKATDADSFAEVLLRYKPGTQRVLADALAGRVSAADAASATGIAQAKIEQAKELLGENSATITTHQLLNVANGAETIAALRSLPNFNLYGLNANDEGAALIGVHGGGKNTHQILQACASGAVKTLVIVGADPFTMFDDRDLVTRALENVEFLVVIDHTQSEATQYATVVLPMAAPAESDGTYTNMEQRVQRMSQILRQHGEAKPVWRIFSELGMRTGWSAPFFSAKEIMSAIGKANPRFAGIDFETLPAEGQRV